ncbi:hypothetical protein NLN62_25340 [Bradyrhizobium sp. CCGUVB23]|nr:hypothetical protein [Bradyrhizobium sp. CCGUVB23]MCP3463563.1 hypothetical protein [Bradyrhizobium sp. CCGUVB23]
MHVDANDTQHQTDHNSGSIFSEAAGYDGRSRFSGRNQFSQRLDDINRLSEQSAG